MSYPLYELTAGAVDTWVPMGGAVNSIWGLFRMAPYISSLGSLFSKADPKIKSLHDALGDLAKAQQEQNFTDFIRAKEKVIAAIDAIQLTPDSEKGQIFKKWGYRDSFKRWDAVLEPLQTLKVALVNYQARLYREADEGELSEAFKGAWQLIHKEITGQEGLMIKALHKTKQVTKDWLSGELAGTLQGAKGIMEEKPVITPLMQLLFHIHEFSFTKRDHVAHVNRVLGEDLAALDRVPFFHGINDHIKRTEDLRSYMEMGPRLIAFIGDKCREKSPEFMDAFRLQIHAVGKKNQLVPRDNTDSPLDWARWYLDQGHIDPTQPKELLTIIEALSNALEIERFEALITPLEEERATRSDIIYKNVHHLQKELQQHPYMKLHPEFNAKMKGLLDHYINNLFAQGFDVNRAHIANGESNFMGALAEISLAIRPKERDREPSTAAQMVDRGVEVMRPWVSAELLDQVSSLAHQGVAMGEALVGADRESPKRFNEPLLDLNKQIQHFRREYSAPRYAGFVQLELDKALVQLEATYPQLAGLTRQVRAQAAEHDGGKLLPNMDRYITAFLLEKVPMEGEDDFRSLYFAAVRQGILAKGDRTGAEAQVARGRQLSATPMDCQAAIWEMAGHRFEQEALVRLLGTLQLTDTDDEATISEKIDGLLAYLESNPHLRESQVALEHVLALITPIVNKLVIFKQSLSPAAQREVDGKYLEAMALLDPALPAEEKLANGAKALRLIKQLFDKGAFAAKVEAATASRAPISEVERLAEDFAADRTHLHAKTEVDKAKQTEINQEQRKLAHNLALFGSFKVMAGYCRVPEQLIDAKFGEILERLDEKAGIYSGLGKVDDENLRREREKLFKEELDKMMTESPRWNFTLLNRIVFWLVKHFTREFTQSIVQNVQVIMHQPANNPLKGHHGVIKGVNNSLLALLFAERRWRSDATGELGVKEKEEKLMEILEELNGVPQQKLIKQVVDKALDEFPIGTFSRFRILNGVATFFVKGVSKLFVNRMGLATSVLQSMSDAIYSDKHVNYNLDGLIIEQLEELEKMLGEDSGELVIHEGDNGKRLVGQLVDNLFALLREKGAMTPAALEMQKQTLLGQLSGAIGEQTDEIIKGVLQNLIIFGYESLLQKDRMNDLLLTMLRRSNDAVRPTKASLLKELYSEVPGVALMTEEELARKFIAEYGTSTRGEVTLKECEAALQRKYSHLEEKLHKTLARILDKTIKGVVSSVIDTTLMTPREAVLKHIEWLENQFDRSKAHARGEVAYIEEMKGLIANIDRAYRANTKPSSELLESLEKRHNKLLVQLQNQLKLLKSKESEETSRDKLQIKRLYKVTAQLVEKLEVVNQKLVQKKYTEAWHAVDALGNEMKMVQATLEGIHATLAWEELTMGESMQETGVAMGRKAAELATPLVRTYLNTHVQGLANEGVQMYKSRAVFKAVMDQAVFSSYMRYEPTPESRQHDQTVAGVMEEKMRDWTIVSDDPIDMTTGGCPWGETPVWLC